MTSSLPQKSNIRIRDERGKVKPLRLKYSKDRKMSRRALLSWGGMRNQADDELCGEGETRRANLTILHETALSSGRFSLKFSRFFLIIIVRSLLFRRGW